MTNIAIDCKNLALYSGGISAFFRPLLAAWLEHRPDVKFFLVGPQFDVSALPKSGNWEKVNISWPTWLPRPLRHPFYDIFLFPRALKRLSLKAVFSPYHDVRLPGPASGVRAAMIIHDTCIEDLPGIYPWRIRAYFLSMLRLNLTAAQLVLTVSAASRARILSQYAIAPERVQVVYNTLDPLFSALVDENAVSALRASYKAGLLLFYAGGCEYRKNTGRLIEALSLLAANGHDPKLLITGVRDAGWNRVLGGAPTSLLERIHFLGRLDLRTLAAHYAAATVIACPTLCEGFGRLCLEAMAVGTPLACSDLAVLREVAGDYPVYFDPLDSAAIAAAIVKAGARGRQTPFFDERFSPASVKKSFLARMDAFLA